MVAVASRAVRLTATNRDDFYVQLVIANIVADLFQAAHYRKVGDGIDERDPAAQRQTGGNPGEVLLSNANIDVAMWKLFCKSFQHGIPQIT